MNNFSHETCKSPSKFEVYPLTVLLGYKCPFPMCFTWFGWQPGCSVGVLLSAPSSRLRL